MPKPKWVGKKPGAVLEAKDLVSKSAPLLLKPNPPAVGPLHPFVPIVWDLTATASIKTNDAIVIAAQNIGQMVRENPNRGLMLLQSLPTDAAARTVFITALNEALKNTSWKIATDDPTKSVLTLFNEARLNKKTLAPPAAAPVLTGAPESHQVDWFSLAGNPAQCYCVGNMQYKSTVTAEQIKADYEAFDDAYYKGKRYTHQAHPFKIIFAGALGNTLQANTAIHNARVFVAPQKNLTTSSVILDEILHVEPNDVTATPFPDYNRRDAAVYYVDGKDDKTTYPWTDAQIEKVLKHRGYQQIQCVPGIPTENPVFFDLDKLKNKTLTFFTNGATTNDKTAEGIPCVNEPNFYLSIFQDLFKFLKTAVKDKLPTTIRFAVPVNTGDHWEPLIFNLTNINSDLLSELIKKSPLKLEDLKTLAGNVDIELLGSTISSNAIKFKENVLKNLFSAPGNCTFTASTPLLQRGDTPDKGSVDCGVITTAQIDNKLEGNPAIALNDFDTYDLTKWNDATVWSEDAKKKYTHQVNALECRLRREYLQQCGAGQAEPDRVKASKPDARKKGEPTRDELVQRSQKKDSFDKILEKYGYSESSKAVLNKADDKGNKSVLYSRNDQGDTLTTEKTSPQTALLMALDLLSQGFDKVEITCSETNREMYITTFTQAGFDPNKIFIKIQEADPTPSKSRDSMQSPFPGMM